MTVRDILPFGRGQVTVNKGGNPIGIFQGEMNRLFEDFFGESLPAAWIGRSAVSAPAFSFSPAIDVKDTEKEVKIIAELPGIDSKDVSVSVADGYVTIKGEKKLESEEKKEGYYRQERSYGSFQRVVALPENANLDKAEASVKNGVLTVSVPKKADSQGKSRTLEIKPAA